MKTSIILQLAKKDFLLWRKTIFSFCLVIVVCIVAIAVLGIAMKPGLWNLGFTLLITPAATCGIVLLIFTNVHEKEKSTQAFIMSLPVTVKEFTLAKLLVNLAVFSTIWLLITCVAFFIAINYSFNSEFLFSPTVPTVTMIFLGIYVAYLGILSVSILSQSLGITICTIGSCGAFTSAYLLFTYTIDRRNHVDWSDLPTYATNYIKNTEIIESVDLIALFLSDIPYPDIVWSSTEIAVVTVQVLVAVSVLAATVFIQNRKRDFI